MKWFSRVTVFVFVTVAVAALVSWGARPASGSNETIDSFIWEEIAAQGQANLFIKMDNDANLDAAYAITDRVERLNYVYNTLTVHAGASQANIITYLQAQGLDYTSFWINNSIYVRNVDAAMVEKLAALDGVAYLRGDRVIILDVPEPTAIEDLPADAAPRAIEWGVDRIQAPDVWASGNTGTGVVVANVDTGVRWTHDAVDDQYRGADGNHNYDWWDPDGVYSTPTDNNGHGTHTMGTMVGDDGGANQIGVAPDAQWIAAQGCDGVSCSSFDLTSSAQWIACPTDLGGGSPNCAMAPHVVNNSWGGGGGDAWYDTYVNSWNAAGIVPVFSSGNSGPSCNSLGSPGDYRRVIGVGATNISNELAYFSSKGPSVFTTRAKSDIVAPGENVRSAYNTSDTAYANLSGTSMAAPHVAGAVALLEADTPGVIARVVHKALSFTALQNLPAPASGATTCGGIPYNVYPNHIYGSGLINVCEAVNTPPFPGGAPCP